MEELFSEELPPEYECDAIRLAELLKIAMCEKCGEKTLFDREPDPDQHVMIVARNEMTEQPATEAWNLRSDYLWDLVDELEEGFPPFREKVHYALAHKEEGDIVTIAMGADNSVLVGPVPMSCDGEGVPEPGSSWPDEMLN